MELIFSHDELRLLWETLLVIALCAAAHRFARRISGDGVQRALDTLLLAYAVAYASVGLTGLLGILNAVTISIATLVFCGALWVLGRGEPVAPVVLGAGTDGWVAIAVAVFVAFYLAMVVVIQRVDPVLADDALTYHFPAAVQWLQTGKLGLYPTWYFNPANTYSPLGGSIFITWWMAPLHNDVTARFAGLPTLLMIFLALWQIARGLNAGAGPGALIAAAAVLSKPFVRQAMLGKDDVQATAFFLIAVVAIFRGREDGRWSPWRIGLALGLCLATKYVVLMSVPLLLLMLPAWKQIPARRGKVLLAAAIVLAIAGPWYARNLWLTGNPVYPVQVNVLGHHALPGLFTPRRSRELDSVAAVWTAMSQRSRDQTLPAILWAMLAVGWCAAAVGARRRLKEPLVRLVLIAPPVGLAMFALTSPYPELRFAYPSLAMLFGAVALGMAGRDICARIAVGAVFLVVAASTNFASLQTEFLAVMTFALTAAMAAVAATVYLIKSHRGILTLAGVVTALLGFGWFYVYYDAYVAFCNAVAPYKWQFHRGDIADAWRFVREKTEAPQTIAYANTYITYPLMGFDLENRVVYAPVSARIHRLTDLPPLVAPITGEDLPGSFSVVLNAGADRAVWMENLRALGATYLFVNKDESLGGPPPEGRFAEDDPAHFHRVFDSDAAAVYHILP